LELVAPVGIVKKQDGSLKALKCIRMVLGEPDASGRRRPVPQEGSEFDLPCDWAMPSIGQMPFLTRLLKDSKHAPKVSRWSTFEIDTATMKTSIEGLFAGGDAADDGPTVVIDAIADGQKAAKAIHAYLQGEEIPAKPFIVTKEFWERPGRKELGEIPESPRRAMHHISVADRVGNFNEVAIGYEFEDMTHECDRCLSCGCLAFDWCDLRLYSEEYGADLGHYKGKVRKHKVDERHPYLVYDPNKCILCARCIRTCEKVLPISALGLINRGFKTEMRPSMNDPLVDTSCIACGNCVDACPTGAILPKFAYKSRAALAAEQSRSHCALCSIACPITVNTISEGGYFINPSGVAGDYLCHDGRFCSELFIKSTRMIEPQKREGMVHTPLEHKEAVTLAAKGLKTAVEQYGPESVAVFLYPDASNEEMYLAGQIAREGLGTNNIGSIAILETGVESGVLDSSFGFTASTADRSVIGDADLIICNNIDPQDELLILSMDIIDAVKDGGAKLIVTGSSKNSLDDLATLSLDPMRGRAALLWNGVVQCLIDQGFFPKDAIASMDGGEAYLGDSNDYDGSRMEMVTGVQKGLIESTADLVSNARKVVIIQSPDRSHDMAPGDVQVMANLTLLLRNRGVRGDLILPSLAANGAGIEVCGADPAFQAGRVPSAGLAGARSRKELLAMLKEGRIKAALVIGEDPMATDRTASYFGGIEFLAAIDWAQTETTQFADVAIPGSTFLESRGTRCNFEGRVISFESAMAPPAGIPGWEVLTGIAAELGLSVGSDFDAVSNELDSVVRANNEATLGMVWNTGQEREWNGRGVLVAADVEAQASSVQPAFSVTSRYRRAKLEVGLSNYRVGARQ
jgi:formate dehydrogenase major subunit